jgi:hypothetical protein
VRLAKGLLGSGQVAHATTDLADLVEAFAGEARVESDELLAGDPSF